MDKYFCYGKKNFCDNINKCRFCKFFDGTGYVDGEFAHSILSGIFGEDYDLDRLKELVEADRDGRCVVLPCKDWLEIVFGDQEVFYGIDTSYIENPIREISVDSSSRCTWCGGWKNVVIKGYDENGFDWDFEPEEIGETVFLTREEAESALERMEGEEK